MTPLKKCFQCNTIKPLSEFFKDAQKSDGHQYKCKECKSSNDKKYRLENIEKCKEYDKKRSKNPERKKLQAEVKKKWRALNPQKHKCHYKVRQAIKKGILIKENCIRCGKDKAHAHHEDYDKPLDVVWLCPPCHTNRHIEILKEKANETPPSV